jgi:CheY-like chemotaxis protein
VARMVLVADDSPTHQRRANGILTGEGLEVVTVSNGVAAIKKLSTMKPALILADVSMPGRDGYEVCEFVKSSPDLARVPVLLIFSDLEPFDEARAQRSRADGRIKKPFGQDELVATVNRFLAEVEEAPPPPPAPAEPAIVTEPVDEEPQVAPREEFPDLSLSEGVAFGDQAFQEAAPGFEPPPIMEQPPAPEPPADSGFGFAPAAEETPAPEVAAAPEAEAPPEAEETPSPEFAVSPEGEAPSEEVAPTEPVFEEEETATAIPPPEPEPAERTMMFRAPVEIAEPMLSDELAPPLPAVTEPEPEAAPPPEAETPPAEVTLAGAASLESYSLADAGAGQVRFAETEGEAGAAAPPAEAGETPPAEALAEEAPGGEAAAPAPPPAEAAAPPAGAETAPPEETVVPAEAAVQVVDTDLVYWIVHSVVVRMAPPALPTPMVEEMIRNLTDEIIGELTQTPPQS